MKTRRSPSAGVLGVGLTLALVAAITLPSVPAAVAGITRDLDSAPGQGANSEPTQSPGGNPQSVVQTVPHETDAVDTPVSSPGWTATGDSAAVSQPDQLEEIDAAGW